MVDEIEDAVSVSEIVGVTRRDTIKAVIAGIRERADALPAGSKYRYAYLDLARDMEASLDARKQGAGE